MATTVVDELVTELTLDAEPYRKVEAQVERETDRTYRKQQERARTTERTNKDQQRRLKDISGGVRDFAKQVTAAVGVVTGLGVAIGGALTGLLGFETGLRRQAVGTGFSNRQMQAWGATARRLGADAQAGAEAIANLSKERQQFNLTGNGPTLQALARMGVNVDPSRPLEEVLSQAQQLYRAAPAAQKQQFENTLSAQGVSPDLILMIKSERDVREAFAQSYAQSTEENRKALDQLADAFESMKATAITISATLLEALQPAIQLGAEKLSEFATDIAAFADQVRAAGGGVEGFQTALDANVPMLGHLFEGFREEATLLEEASAVARRGFREWGQLLTPLISKMASFLGYDSGAVDKDGLPTRLTTGQKVAIGVSEWWKGLVGDSRQANAAAAAGNPYNLPRNIENDPPPDPRNPYGLPRNIENDKPGQDPRNPSNLPRNIENDPPGPPVKSDALSIMTKLTTQYGLTAQQAAAVTANWQSESALRPDAVNTAGGGNGARGLAQWRGDRIAAFQKRYGTTPDKAPLEQQIEFAMTDPYERALMTKAFDKGGNAEQLGVAYSRHYEAHGNAAEDARRGRNAQALAAGFNGAAAAPGKTTEVNIQTLNVTTPDANAFVGGITRISDSQNYNSVMR